jgi:hypothetical protein
VREFRWSVTIGTVAKHTFVVFGETLPWRPIQRQCAANLQNARDETQGIFVVEMLGATRSELPYWGPPDVVRLTSGATTAEPHRDATPFSTMAEATVLQWQTKARAGLHRVTAAERRFSASLRINEVTMLAAADELQVAARETTKWLIANPCPDWKRGAHAVRMLNTCAEVALTAQQVITDPFADTQAVMDRLSNLLAVIDFHSQLLDA